MTGRSAGVDGRRRGVRALSLYIDRHCAALLVVLLAFLGRLYLSGMNSYWLDELYSVYFHATTRETFSDVIDSMRGIIHPPLYQIVLFQWIKIFGDTEVATRSLSNLFVMMASWFLYVFAYRIYGRRVALVSLLVFSMMHIPIFYALETRSYAMAIMWAAASSLSLYYFLKEMPLLCGWKGFLTSRSFVLLTAINTAAIFTHYYLAFFVAAQGVFILLFFLCRHEGWRRPWAWMRLAVLGGLPPVILVLLWGGSMLQRYRKGGRFNVDEPEQGLLDAVLQHVIAPNVSVANIAVMVISLFALVFVGRSILRIVGDRSAFRPYMTIYVAFWLFVPVMLAFMVLTLIGQDAYNQRYFVFSSPPIALLLTVGAFELARLSSLATRKLFGFSPMRSVYGSSIVLGAVVAIGTVAQNGYSAAVNEKHDWRLIARLVAETIHTDKKNRYIVYDTGFRRDSMLNYYFERNRGNVRSHKVITKHNEGRNRLPFQGDRKKIQNHDYIVIVFTHLSTGNYKNAIRYLDEHYEEHYRVMPMRNRGYIVYRVHSDSSSSAGD